MFYQGNGLFPGIEAVFHHGRPVWSTAYFGDYSQMTEGQADGMLRSALMVLAETMRTHLHVDEDFGGYRYVCAGQGSVRQM